MTPYFVSFRPEVPMEVNLPTFTPVEDPHVPELLRNAAGVLLPSHVSPWRYESLTRHARAWFPRLEGRFAFQGKTRQIPLFERLGVRHPESLIFSAPRSLEAYLEEHGSPWGYPLVLKGDMGGGGETVFPIHAPRELAAPLTALPQDRPLLIQRWVEHGGKDLRVVTYGERAVSYFRVGGGQFYNNVCRGGRLDHEGWPALQAKGVEAALAFSRRAGIDMAGYDLMFPDEGDPVFIEVNFHFGRKGLGGQKGHRKLLLEAIDRWRARCLVAVGSRPFAP